jgi:hypothetical protein
VAASVVQAVNGAVVASDAPTVTATLSNAIVAGDVVVALIGCSAATTDHNVSGLGATWRRVARDSSNVLDLWIGTGATATGTVTATQTSAVGGQTKYLALWHLRGTTTSYYGAADIATGDTLISTAMNAGPGQIFIGAGFSNLAANSFTSPSPATGWTTSTVEFPGATRWATGAHRIPTGNESHKFTTFRTGSTVHPIVRIVVGTNEIPAPAQVRTNLVKNPRFGLGTTTHWATKNGVTLSASTAVTPYSGTYTGLFANETGTNQILYAVYGADLGASTTANADSIPITAGQKLTITIWAKQHGGTSILGYPFIYWFNSSGTLLSSSVGDSNFFSTSWEGRTLTATAPTNAASASVGLYSNTAQATGRGYHIGAVFAGIDDSGGGYLDGAKATTADYAYAWTGTADDSASTETKLRRRNWVTNPSAETNASEWTFPGVATSSTQAKFGTQSLKLTATGSTLTLTANPSVAPNLERFAAFTASAWVYPPRALQARAVLYAAGAVTGDALRTIPANTWTRVYSVGYQHGNTGVQAMRVEISGAVSGDLIYVDGVMLEQSYALEEYFDGSTILPGYTNAWTGTAHASTSTQTSGAPAELSVDFKRRESGVWVPHTAVPKVRAGGAWVERQPQYWNGTAWVDLP